MSAPSLRAHIKFPSPACFLSLGIFPLGPIYTPDAAKAFVHVNDQAAVGDPGTQYLAPDDLSGDSGSNLPQPLTLLTTWKQALSGQRLIDPVHNVTPEAINYIERVADQGHRLATLHCENMLNEGTWVTRDLGKAAKYLARMNILDMA
jgi:TPR repeat protein